MMGTLMSFMAATSRGKQSAKRPTPERDRLIARVKHTRLEVRIIQIRNSFNNNV
jgi:hypothetical protein